VVLKRLSSRLVVCFVCEQTYETNKKRHHINNLACRLVNKVYIGHLTHDTRTSVWVYVRVCVCVGVVDVCKKCTLGQRGDGWIRNAGG
jgi:hypothetical protein